MNAKNFFLSRQYKSLTDLILNRFLLTREFSIVARNNENSFKFAEKELKNYSVLILTSHYKHLKLSNKELHIKLFFYAFNNLCIRYSLRLIENWEYSMPLDTRRSKELIFKELQHTDICMAKLLLSLQSTSPVRMNEFCEQLSKSMIKLESITLYDLHCITIILEEFFNF